MIITVNDLSVIRNKHRDEKIVLTSGTYDLLHVGHLHYLEAVKQYGHVLIIMLSGDRRIRDRKGVKRPIIPETERGELLDALKVVDYVFIDPGVNTEDQVDPVYKSILDELQPDIYVTDGEDVRLSNILDKSKYIVLPRVEGGKYGSTTAIIEDVNKLG